MKKNWIYFVIACLFIFVIFFILQNENILTLNINFDFIHHLYNDYFCKYLSFILGDFFAYEHPLSGILGCSYASLILYMIIDPTIYLKFTPIGFETFTMILIVIVVILFFIGI